MENFKAKRKPSTEPLSTDKCTKTLNGVELWAESEMTLEQAGTGRENEIVKVLSAALFPNGGLESIIKMRVIRVVRLLRSISEQQTGFPLLLTALTDWRVIKFAMQQYQCPETENTVFEVETLRRTWAGPQTNESQKKRPLQVLMGGGKSGTYNLRMTSVGRYSSANKNDKVMQMLSNLYEKLLEYTYQADPREQSVFHLQQFAHAQAKLGVPLPPTVYEAVAQKAGIQWEKGEKTEGFLPLNRGYRPNVEDDNDSDSDERDP